MSAAQGDAQAVSADVLKRLHDAQNRHDLDAMVDCFDAAYRSEQPVHPDRAFTGREQVRQNWAAVFDGVPDFRAELLRSAEVEDAHWAEWDWHGPRADGSRVDVRGSMEFGTQHGRVLWGGRHMRDIGLAGRIVLH